MAVLMLRWNRRINLVSAASADVIHARHVRDCLQLVPFIPSEVQLALDIGSGAGFPGLVLAITTNIPFLLVEADQRRAAFLREAIRVTNANATVLAQRVETVRATVDLVTARGVAALPALLAWAYPLLGRRGTCLFLKGEGSDDELHRAQRDWSLDALVHPSATRNGGAVVEIRNLRPIRSGAGKP